MSCHDWTFVSLAYRCSHPMKSNYFRYKDESSNNTLAGDYRQQLLHAVFSPVRVFR